MMIRPVLFTLLLSAIGSYPAYADDAEIAEALKDKGVKVTAAKGVVTTVAIADGKKLTDEDFGRIAKFAHLKSLDVGSGLTDERLALLAGLAELEYLQTNLAQVTDDGLKPLAKCRNLRYLKFFHPGPSFSGAGLAHLADLPQLQSLTVAGSPAFNDDGMAAVARLKTLQEFRTWHASATNDGVKKLKELPNLKSLNLGQRLSYKPPACPTDDTLATLAELKSLEVLQLSETRLTYAALQRLKQLPALKKLILEGVDLSNEDLERLKKELPAVSITWKAPDERYLRRIRALLGAEKSQ
jgi:hypothetical protein